MSRLDDQALRVVEAHLQHEDRLLLSAGLTRQELQRQQRIVAEMERVMKPLRQMEAPRYGAQRNRIELRQSLGIPDSDLQQRLQIMAKVRFLKRPLVPECVTRRFDDYGTDSKP